MCVHFKTEFRALASGACGELSSIPFCCNVSRDQEKIYNGTFNNLLFLVYEQCKEFCRLIERLGPGVLKYNASKIIEIFTIPFSKIILIVFNYRWLEF